MTTEAAVTWLMPVACGRDDRAKSRENRSLLSAPDLQNTRRSQKGSHQPLNLVVFENGLVLLFLTSWEEDPTVTPDVGPCFLGTEKTGPIPLQGAAVEICSWVEEWISLCL